MNKIPFPVHHNFLEKGYQIQKNHSGKEKDGQQGGQINLYNEEPSFSVLSHSIHCDTFLGPFMYQAEYS